MPETNEASENPRPSLAPKAANARKYVAIQYRFLDLDNAILHADGSPRILEAARLLSEALRLQLQNEQPEEPAAPEAISPRQMGNRWVWRELNWLDESLRYEEVDAALRLRALCKKWMREHHVAPEENTIMIPPPTQPPFSNAVY